MLLVLVLCFACLAGCFEQTPGGETPGGETPGGDTPGGETPGGDTPGGETPGGDTPGGDTPGGDTPGGEEKKDLTAADIVADANEAIKELNETNFSEIEPDDFVGELDVDELLQELKKLEGQIRVKTESGDESTDIFFALKDGVIYNQGTYGNDLYLTVIGETLAAAFYHEGEDFVPYASYMLVSAFLQRIGLGAQPEPTMEEYVPQSPADILASLDIELPLMTEEDIAVDGTTFTIKNSYITNVIKALLDSLPDGSLGDESGLASFKTMLPGMIDNLGLKIEMEAKGAEIIGFSFSFDANSDFKAMFDIPADVVIKGSFAATATDDGEDLSSLALDLELAGQIDLGFVVSATYADDELDTITLDLDLDLNDVQLAHYDDARFDEATGSMAEFYYSLMGNRSIRLDLSLTPKAILKYADPNLRLVTGSFSMTMVPETLYVNGEPMEEPDEIGSTMIENNQGTGTVSISSDKSGVDETTIWIEIESPDGDKSNIEIAFTLGSAPNFKEMPDELKGLLQEDYSELYTNLHALAEESGLEGTFAYLTEEGNTMVFFYYSSISDASFTLYAGEMENEYQYRIVYENGEYVICEESSDKTDVSGNPGGDFSEEWKIDFPGDAE